MWLWRSVLVANKLARKDSAGSSAVLMSSTSSDWLECRGPNQPQAPSQSPLQTACFVRVSIVLNDSDVVGHVAETPTLPLVDCIVCTLCASPACLTHDTCTKSPITTPPLTVAAHPWWEEVQTPQQWACLSYGKENRVHRYFLVFSSGVHWRCKMSTGLRHRQKSNDEPRHNHRNDKLRRTAQSTAATTGCDSHPAETFVPTELELLRSRN